MLKHTPAAYSGNKEHDCRERADVAGTQDNHAHDPMKRMAFFRIVLHWRSHGWTSETSVVPTHVSLPCGYDHTKRKPTRFPAGVR
jgi:hypothetical protein